jgi:hypothetical protein
VAIAKSRSGNLEDEALRLPHDGYSRAACHLDGGYDGAGARPWTVRHRKGRVAPCRVQVGASAQGLCGGAKLVVVESVVTTDRDDLGCARRRALVEHEVVTSQLGLERRRSDCEHTCARSLAFADIPCKGAARRNDLVRLGWDAELCQSSGILGA